MSPLLSQDGVSTKAMHEEQQDVRHEDGDRTAANGATRVQDWEQESESRDRRHSQQHGTVGAEEKLGKGSRSHVCPWTCLSGTSVSPPHPCIQSPGLTGTRRGGLSNTLRAKMSRSLPPLGPGCYWLPAQCCSMQGQTPQPLEQAVLCLDGTGPPQQCTPVTPTGAPHRVLGHCPAHR